MACPNGSGTKEGVSGVQIVRIRYGDFAARPASSYSEYGIQRNASRDGWNVDITNLTSPEHLSEYGVIYSELMSNFCGSEPPTVFPGAPAGIQNFLAASARSIWNQNCRCLPPPGQDYCNLYNGQGQCPTAYRVRLEYDFTTFGVNGGAQHRDTTVTVYGKIKEYDEEVFPPNSAGNSLYIGIYVGAQNQPDYRQYQSFGSYGYNSGTAASPPRNRKITIERVDGQADACCTPPPPNPEPEFPQNTVRVSVDGNEEPEVQVIFIPCPQGEKGDKGDDGIAGAKGNTGETGARGEIGATGSEGNPGRDGIDGSRGATGDRGIPGVDGQDGIDGVDGAAGADGSPGVDGRAATIAIRTITKIALDAVGYATNTGTVTDAVYDLFVPGDVEIIQKSINVSDCNDDGKLIATPVTIDVLSDGVSDTSSSVSALTNAIDNVLQHLCKPLENPVTKRSETVTGQGKVMWGLGDYDCAFIIASGIPSGLSRRDGSEDRFDRLFIGSFHQIVFGGSVPEKHMEFLYMFERFDPLCVGLYFDLLPMVSATIYLQKFE